MSMSVETDVEGSVGSTVHVERLNSKGRWHCETGPAVVSDVLEMWCVDGKPHRVGGPAIIGKDYKAWYVDGLRHRVDGPARVFGEGSQEWWLFGVMVDEEIFGRFSRLKAPAKEIFLDAVRSAETDLEGLLTRLEMVS